MRLTNNTILITGGTSGIGYILGKALLERNNTVILLGRNKKKLAEARKEGFETIVCDLNKTEEIEEASITIQNQFPGLNMLFNNAGVQFNYDFIDSVVQPDKIYDEININITGQLLLTQRLIPLLNNNEHPFIINTTSGLGAFPKSDGIVYSATKAAMRNFTKALRYGLKAQGIKVLEFIPPVTDTGMTHGRDEQKMSPEELVRQIMPQLEKERKILTVTKMRFFLWISFLLPGLADKILSKA
ncbi:MAG: SDR family oxidoreductase [Bacteroidota bacterium]